MQEQRCRMCMSLKNGMEGMFFSIPLVQVIKEERGNKGAALTTYLSLVYGQESLVLDFGIVSFILQITTLNI